jgi:hypothetical protein
MQQQPGWPGAQPDGPGTSPTGGLSEDLPRLTHRRNSLAQSRRLGLGPAIRREGGAEQGSDAGSTDADAEPAPGGSQSAPAPTAAPPPPPASATAAPAPAGPPAPAPAVPIPPPPVDPAPPPTAPDAAPAAALGAGTDADRDEQSPAVRPPITPVVVPGRPITDGTHRPQTSAVPLLFRSTRARTAPSGAERTPRGIVTRPPAELANALRNSHGIEVADVQIQRDTAVSSEARDRNARAFTRGGRVHIPAEAGALTDGPARALLVHELIHAAQQRRLGTLPAEHSPEGQALELEAQEAEHSYGGDAPLVHTPPPVSAGWVEDRITQHAWTRPISNSVPNWQLASSESQQDEIAYIAKQVFETLQQDGGGGSGSTASSLAASFGKSGATTLDEFKADALAQFNFEMAKVGGKHIDTFDQLDKALQDMVTENFAKADEARKQLATKQAERDKESRKLKKDAEEKKADEAEKKQGGEEWNRGVGFSTVTPGDGKGEKPDASGKDEDEDEDKDESGSKPTSGAKVGTVALTPGMLPKPTPPKSAAEVERAVRRKRLGKLTAVQAAELEPMPDVNGASNEEEYLAYVVGVINSERARQGMRTITVAELPAGRADEFKRDFVAQQKKLRQQKLEAAAKRDRIDAETRRIQNEARIALELPTLEEDEAAEDREAVENARKAEQQYQQELAAWQAQQAGKGAGAPQQTPGSLVAPSAHDFFAAEHLEELTRRIYPRIRTRLHKELLVDRERAGSLTNFH